MLGDWFNQLLSQQMKMDKIAKNMVPNAHSAGKEPKSSVWYSPGKMTQGVHISTGNHWCVWHNCLKNWSCVYIFQATMFGDGIQQNKKHCLCIFH